MRSAAFQPFEALRGVSSINLINQRTYKLSCAQAYEKTPAGTVRSVVCTMYTCFNSAGSAVCASGPRTVALMRV